MNQEGIERTNWCPEDFSNPGTSTRSPRGLSRARHNRMQNRKTAPPPTVDLLAEGRRLFEFREDGVLVWKAPTNERAHKLVMGSPVGSSDGHGYKSCRLLGHKFKVHHVVWLLCHGELPPMPIDHINGVRPDNRIGNLRLATDQQNTWNRHAPGDRTAIPGIWLRASGKAWSARIRQDDQDRYLGSFPSRREAEAAWLAASVEMRGEFSVSGRNLTQLLPHDNGGM